MNTDLMLRIFNVTSNNDDTDGIWWRTDGEFAPVTFLVNCNDLFYWACSDAEVITESNIDILEKAYKDAKELYEFGECYAQTLFCCRARKMRPQTPYYKHIPKELHDLFDECGEKRD